MKLSEADKSKIKTTFKVRHISLKVKLAKPKVKMKLQNS